MIKKIFAICIFIVSCTSYDNIQQAFLVQNSGWMEPFYTDPNSQFKPLISAVANSLLGRVLATSFTAYSNTLSVTGMFLISF